MPDIFVTDGVLLGTASREAVTVGPRVTRILLVDDDPQFRRTLRLALGSQGYDVSEAADGKEALDLAVAQNPDLIVLDWHLPKINGIDTCRALRSSSEVPIIMISANRTNSKAIALDAGATDYLTKPFSLNDLITRIQSAMNE